MTNPIHRSHHPAAPLSPVTQRLYDECNAASELLKTPGLDLETHMWLIEQRGKLTNDIWSAARRERVT